MVYDCFTFNNELLVLKLRLATLAPFVDQFILVESEWTQSRLKKPLYFQENKELFGPYLHKINHIIYNDYNSGTGWQQENGQRNAISIGLKGIQPNDTVMISDLDEIPKPEVIQNFKMLGLDKAVVSMKHFCYYFNLMASTRYWNGTVIAKGSILSELSPQDLRNNKDYLPQITCIGTGGWHMSWIMNATNIYKKLLHCIEPLDKSHLPSEDTIGAILKCKDKWFIHAEDPYDQRIPLIRVPLDESFPNDLINNKNQYKEFIL